MTHIESHLWINYSLQCSERNFIFTKGDGCHAGGNYSILYTISRCITKIVYSELSTCSSTWQLINIFFASSVMTLLDARTHTESSNFAFHLIMFLFRFTLGRCC